MVQCWSIRQLLNEPYHHHSNVKIKRPFNFTDVQRPFSNKNWNLNFSLHLSLQCTRNFFYLFCWRVVWLFQRWRTMLHWCLTNPKRQLCPLAVPEVRCLPSFSFGPLSSTTNGFVFFFYLLALESDLSDLSGPRYQTTFVGTIDGMVHAIDGRKYDACQKNFRKPNYANVSRWPLLHCCLSLHSFCWLCNDLNCCLTSQNISLKKSQKTVLV